MVTTAPASRFRLLPWRVAACLLAGGLAALPACSRVPAEAAGTPRADRPAIAPVDPALAQRERLRDSPQARAWQARRRFEAEARDFVREAPALPAAERRARADRLEAEIDQRERARELSAGEAVLLRAALVQAQAASSEEQAGRMAALLQRYRENAARREAAWTARQRNDPRMRRYKAREQAVVAEVMSMPEIPGGLSRDAYLRQRLQAERERAWAGR